MSPAFAARYQTASASHSVAGRISATSAPVRSPMEMAQPFDDADVQSAVEVAHDLVFDLPWESGDVALIDSY